MDTTADSFKTELNDRVLWFDGDSTVNAETLTKYIMAGKSVDGLFVNELTPDIVQYNSNVSKKDKIGCKESCRPFAFDWDIPEEYKNTDVVKYVFDKLRDDSPHLNDLHDRSKRVEEEFVLYEELGLMDVLAALIYIINTLIENNVVWGVGRGSSVSSYVLYLIGVHDIDSYKYGLNIGEFLRTK